MAVRDFFEHVEIHVVMGNRDGARTVFLVQKVGHLVEQRLARVKPRPVMIADQHVHRAFFDVTLNFVDVEKALAPFGIFRLFAGRQHLLPLRGHRQRVDHFPLGVAGVHASSAKGHHWIFGVEIFVFQSAQLTAVHGVGEIGAKTVDVETERAPARFLIRCKGHADFSVFYFRMLNQLFHRADNRRDSGFIVGAEKRRAVGEDHVLPRVLGHFRKSRRRKHDALFSVQHHVAAVVISDNLRMHVLARCVRRRVHMGDQADHRPVLRHICRQCRHDVAIGVQLNLLHADAC